MHMPGISMPSVKELEMIPIYGEMFLLALNEDKGSITSFAKKTIAYGLAGALLSELALEGKVCSNEKHRLEWLQSDPIGDEILDYLFQDIQSAGKHHKLTYWINQLCERPKVLRTRVVENLVAVEVLYEEDNHFFRTLPSSDSNYLAIPNKYEKKQALRAMILSTGKSDHRNLALLNMLVASGLLGLIFTQDELVTAERRIHEAVVREALENPAMQTIEDIERAVIDCIEDGEG